MLKKLKKYLLAVLLTVPFSVMAEGADLTNLNSVNNNPSFGHGDYISDNYQNVIKIPSDYKFSPKFISGVTTSEVFGDASASISNGYATLTKTGSGILYKNVGSYDGKVVDMQLRIENVNSLGYSNSNNTFYGLFELNGFHFNVYNGQEVTIRRSFYVHNTNTPIYVKGNLTVFDIDGSQGVYFENNGESKIYVSKNSSLNYKYVDGYNLIYCGGNSDVDVNMPNAWDNGYGPNQKNMITYTFNAASITMKYLINTDNSSGGFALNSYPIVPIENKISKYVSNEMNNGLATSNKLKSQNDIFYYTILSEANLLPPTYYFRDYIIKDSLNKNLDIKEIKIYDEKGTDVTKKFKITTNNNEVIAKANDSQTLGFYEHTYKMVIKVKIKDNTKLQFTNNIYTLTNQSSLEITTITFLSTNVSSTLKLGSNIVSTDVPKPVSNPNTSDIKILLYSIVTISLISIILISNKKLKKISL